MHSVKIAAALAAALQIAAGSTGARAADLDYRTLPPDRYGSAYEDPRYADIYGPAHPPRYEPYVERYAERYSERVPIPREPVYRDRYDGAPGPYAEGPPPAYYGQRPGCLPRGEIRHRLERDGWSSFSAAEAQGQVASVRARRPDGRPFALKIDRCTGEIVDARPLSSGGYGPYADAPRRYGRYY